MENYIDIMRQDVFEIEWGIEDVVNYNIHFSCINHIGNYRRINQDNFICNGKYREIENDNTKFQLTGCTSNLASIIFGVFDGMGGEECGEIASYIAAKSAASTTIVRDAAVDISKYCMEVNEKIYKYAKDNSISAMGTTAAILVFAKKEIILCNIGDSKIFHFSNGVLNQISHDHNMISVYGKKAPLSQNLGIPPTELKIEPYIARYKYKSGDIYLICSDGLTDMVGLDELEILLCRTSYSGITNELLDKALSNGGKDNITIITCRIERNINGIFKSFA